MDPLPDAALLQAIRVVLDDSPFHGEGHRKVRDRLGVSDIRSSRRRALRLMRENNLLARSRAGTPRGPSNHDGAITPDTLDTVWCTDLTTTITGEGQAAVFIAIDHCSAECVGIHADRQATRFQAVEPIRQGVRRHFGGFVHNTTRGLRLRHDHCSQYMSVAFRSELRFLGIESSPTFARAPEGNGCAERFIRTPKKTSCGSGRSKLSRPCALRCSSSEKAKLQHHLADRAARAHLPSRPAPKPRSIRGPRGVAFKPGHQKPRAVHSGGSRNAVRGQYFRPFSLNRDKAAGSSAA